ncbi:MAG: Mediator of RNA polymerase II transcription subunit 18 [Trizodia sp. TS-e1964]|nr:MAG: Mediator of RNA polymerase II transcription subunit 18 [Trizodia sp. TS-e1964]
MHELSLFSQVALARHDLVLRILAGVSGMQPERTIERHLLYKSRRTPASKTAQSNPQTLQSQQIQALRAQLKGEPYYLKLIGAVDEQDFGEDGGTSTPRDLEDAEMTGQEAASASGYDIDEQQWSLRFSDLPDVPVAATRSVTSRMISIVDITDGNGLDLMAEQGNMYEYVLEGHQAIHNNIILHLFRIRRFPKRSQSQAASNSGPSPLKRLPPLKSLRLLDPSGGYILQASIRLQDGGKPESISLGVDELKQFKELTKGVIELDAGERLALDTRVK